MSESSVLLPSLWRRLGSVALMGALYILLVVVFHKFGVFLALPRLCLVCVCVFYVVCVV